MQLFFLCLYSIIRLGDSEQQDLDMILLLSQRSVYVAWYDDEQELVSRYQRIYLEDIDKIEIG